MSGGGEVEGKQVVTATPEPAGGSSHNDDDNDVEDSSGGAMDIGGNSSYDGNARAGTRLEQLMRQCDELDAEMDSLSRQIALAADPVQTKHRIREHRLAIRAIELRKQWFYQKQRFSELQALKEEPYRFKSDPAFYPQLERLMQRLSSYHTFTEENLRRARDTLQAQRFIPEVPAKKNPLKRRCKSLMNKNTELGQLASRSKTKALKKQVKELRAALTQRQRAHAPVKQLQATMAKQLWDIDCQLIHFKTTYQQQQQQQQQQGAATTQQMPLPALSPMFAAALSAPDDFDIVHAMDPLLPEHVVSRAAHLLAPPPCTSSSSSSRWWTADN